MNRRTALVAFALAVLAATAPMVAVANTVELGSHTTDSDFEAADLLEHVYINGTGDSASVRFQHVDQVIDDFEDGDATDTKLGPWSDWQGSADSWSAQNTYVISGSWTGRKDTGNFDQTKYIERSEGTQRNFSATVHPERSRNRNGPFHEVNVWNGGHGGTRLAGVRFYENTSNGGDIHFWNGQNHDLGVDWTSQTDGGNAITVRFEWDFPNDQVTVVIDGTTQGTFDLQNAAIEYDAAGFRTNNLPGGDGSADLFVDDIEEDASEPTGTYISANYTNIDADNAWADLTLSDADANVTWEGWTGSSWTEVGSANYTTSGNRTISLDDTDVSKYRVNVTYHSNGSSPDAQLDDEGVSFESSAPTVDNSSASPSGGTQVSDKDVTLSIDVNDSDFPTDQGDSVTVEFYVNGTKEGSKTISSNQTVDLSYTETTGGPREWHAWANDSYGNTQQSQTFNFETPSNLTIREETEPHDKVTGATVTVKFYEEGNTDDPTIVNRTTTTGEVDLSGLPVGTKFAVTVQASGYYNRTALLDDLYEQETVFLLNKSRAEVSNTFTLEDKSGNFPEGETELRIQRAINKSIYDSNADGFEYMTIVGDNMGADQSLVTTLHEGERYRIRVDNQDGDQRFLGAYNAKSGGTIELTIGTVNLTVTQAETYNYTASFNESGNDNIQFTFKDVTDNTSDLRLIIHEYNNESNEIVNTTSAGPFGTFTFTQSLTASQAEKGWVVKFEANHSSLDTISGARLVGADRANIGIPIDQKWQEPIAVIAIVIVAGLFGGIRVQAGMIVASFLSAIFWYLGFLPTSVSGGMVFGGLFLGILYTVGTNRGEPVA